ncbi:hypothetical protein GCM10023322_56500 [Rugosimonospora acidiphila]|uniref:NodB homology domain-containing protein n=1 Tax=Rugosimonospora acidiphila TaxID=556531 RepID=A0ABP9SD34_9ACTN
MDTGHRLIETPATHLADLRYESGCVALTFDDGPDPTWTGQVLDLLEESGTPATFFVLGRMIRGHERILRRMVRLGCSVQVHAWEHVRMTDQPADRRRVDIDRTRRLIREVTGHDPSCVRPPEGRVDADVIDSIESAGLTPVFWSVHGRDWTRPGVAAIEGDVLAGLHDGAVVLLHDGGGDRSQTVAAVPRIIEAIKDRALRPVSLSAPPRSHRDHPNG